MDKSGTRIVYPLSKEQGRSGVLPRPYGLNHLHRHQDAEVVGGVGGADDAGAEGFG